MVHTYGHLSYKFDIPYVLQSERVVVSNYAVLKKIFLHCVQEGFFRLERPVLAMVECRRLQNQV